MVLLFFCRRYLTCFGVCFFLFPSRWEILVFSSCCSSSSMLLWEWSSLANWVSHQQEKKQNKDTHTHCSTHFARKGFWIQASLLQSRFAANFPPFFVSSLPVLTKERSHLHDPIYLHYCFFKGLTLSNSFCLSLCGKSVRKKKKRTSGKMKWKTTFW